MNAEALAGTILSASKAHNKEGGASIPPVVPRALHGSPRAMHLGEQNEPPRATAYTPSATTFLIVEGQPSAREALGELLREDFGCQTLLAANAEQALALADAHQTSLHLLLTDIRLPGMAGEELAASLIEKQPRLKVIFMFGSPDPPARGRPFIQKPLDMNMLRKLIEHTLWG